LTVTLVLPEAFVAHCRADGVEPAAVLQGLVADLWPHARRATARAGRR